MDGVEWFVCFGQFLVVANPAIGGCSCTVIGSATPNNRTKWVVEIAGNECAGCVGGGHGVTVDVGKAVGVFGIACLERTDGELDVTRKVYVFFGNLPGGITGVVGGVTGGGETIYSRFVMISM